MTYKETYSRTGKAIRELGQMNNRSVMSKLRKARTLSPQNYPDIWPLLYRNMVESNNQSAKADSAVLGACIVFSNLKYNSTLLENYFSNKENSNKLTIAEFLRAASYSSDNKESFDKKVSDMLTQTDIEAIFRRLLSLVKQNKKLSLELDYPSLAADLYLLQQPSSHKNVLFSWGKKYYMKNEQGETK